MSVTEKTVKVISGHFMFRERAARDFGAAAIDVVSRWRNG
jgi:hypothetical protein